MPTSEAPDIYVYPEYGWTCQACFATVKGFDSEQAAKTDSESHKCEEYQT